MARERAIVATVNQIKALIRSHLDRDDERFLALALQVAASEARQGHGKAAAELRALVDEARKKSHASRRPIPIATPRGELTGLLSVSMPSTKLTDMVLHEPIRARLERVLREQRAFDKLQAHGLDPARKLLLVGPPGTGKTMTAAALAGELRLPLYVIVLHALITRFMGETAAKLRLIFDALQEHRGVYLFDEFDAIGTERASGSDVGEIRRVLNSFLQFLEQDDSRSLVVAATNHPSTLDRALFRRFDMVVEYSAPTEALAQAAIANRLAAFDASGLDWEAIRPTTAGLSYAEVVAACDAAAKDAVLRDTMTITTEQLQAALEERRHAKQG
ncbi:MAG: AAA family ATPase [Deltaproteobacteria bacterium]|nr:MAG: AAA family ATPase [Deltaproteobacteria bacterium]